MDRGVITYTGNAATVRANNARPLEQAIEAVREQYGWTVDFEDPPYESAYDLVDSTDPQWRKEHPTAKGVRRIAGGHLPPPSSSERAEYHLQIPNSRCSNT